jgi:undecaprenyl-diphosphatase
VGDLLWWQAAVLGVVQGFAEFLPISSSAHLMLAPWVLGWPAPGLAFDVALHVGTLAAVLWYFRAQWADVTRAAARVVRTRRADGPVERQAVWLALGTIPAGVAGLALDDLAETAFRAPAVAAVALVVVGVLLWWVDRTAPRRRDLTALGWRDALAIGAAQACALVPGVSRSGATITAGRALGLDRASAAAFSFLLSAPITVAAAAAKVPDALAAPGSTAPLAVGIVAAAASGWMAIAGLLRFVSRRGYGVFAVYRVALGLGILVLLATRGAP